MAEAARMAGPQSGPRPSRPQSWPRCWPRSWPITACTLASGLGRGRAATFEALAAGRSGLVRRRFETADIDTWLGVVDEVDEVRLPAALAAFDCRNNRLAHLALHTDGFAEAVQAAAARFGAHRVGVFLGTSTSGILSTEVAYREAAQRRQVVVDLPLPAEELQRGPREVRPPREREADADPPAVRVGEDPVALLPGDAEQARDLLPAAGDGLGVGRQRRRLVHVILL